MNESAKRWISVVALAVLFYALGSGQTSYASSPSSNYFVSSTGFDWDDYGGYDSDYDYGGYDSDYDYGGYDSDYDYGGYDFDYDYGGYDSGYDHGRYNSGYDYGRYDSGYHYGGYDWYENPAPGDDGSPDCAPGQAPVYVGQDDQYGLDGDGDGIGCE